MGTRKVWESPWVTCFHHDKLWSIHGNDFGFKRSRLTATWVNKNFKTGTWNCALILRFNHWRDFIIIPQNWLAGLMIFRRFTTQLNSIFLQRCQNRAIIICYVAGMVVKKCCVLIELIGSGKFSTSFLTVFQVSCSTRKTTMWFCQRRHCHDYWQKSYTKLHFFNVRIFFRYLLIYRGGGGGNLIRIYILKGTE